MCDDKLVLAAGLVWVITARNVIHLRTDEMQVQNIQAAHE
jgi:hypothetical protein